MSRRALAAALCAFWAGTLALPGTAPAARVLETGIADDGVLITHPERGPAAVLEWRKLGIDVVRIHARWVAIAPGQQKRRPPAGFDPTDPDDPHYDFKLVDRAVALVRAAGMRVMLTITGSGPLWGSEVPAAGNSRLRPDPRRFGQFAEAVARRYAVQVDRYLIWNEPNQPGWLQPQSSCNAARRPVCTPVAPVIYRALVRAAYPAIKRADPGAQVLVGTLAPRGKPPTKRNVGMQPLAFLRAFGCVDAKLRRVRTGSCAGFRPIPADGFSYHPHGVLASPTQHSPDPDNAAIADLPRVEHTLDALTRTGAFSRRLDLYLTEFGYQTNPPDPFSGVSPTKQADWLAESAYIAWRDPRVRNLTQYAWRDEPVDRRGKGAAAYAKWQSGLLYADGRSKPLRRQFAAPIWLDAHRGVLWGMVRPGGAAAVEVQRRLAGATRSTVRRRLTTRPDGTFVMRLPDRRPAAYRYVALVAPASLGGLPQLLTSVRRVLPARRAARRG